MPTTVLQSNTVAFPSQPLRTKRKKTEPAPSPEKQLQLRLHLLSRLQTSLEMEKILQIFFDETKKELGLSSLHYSNPKLSDDIVLGRKTKHSCDYNLENAETPLGTLSFTRGRRFLEDELERLESYLSCLVCPLQNAFIYRVAIESALKDPLTGAGNRLALENTLEREVNLSLRHKQPLSLLIVDIDNFKQVNDNHGHATGDLVLKQVAEQLGTCYRDTDAAYRAYRYGGEEFVIILNKTNQHGSHLVGERIRKSVESLNINVGGAELNITVSVGVASLLSNDTMSRLFQRADKALYRAKHQGRNRMISAKELKLESKKMLIC